MTKTRIFSLATLSIGALALSASLVFADLEPEAAPAPIAPGEVAPDAVAVVDPDEIKKLLANLTIYGRYVDGENWIEYHLSDGRTAYWEKGCTYPGTWWMESGQVCYAYPNYNDGAPNCFILFRRSDGGIQFVALDMDGVGYLASFSLKTASGNDAHLPVGGLSPCVGA